MAKGTIIFIFILGILASLLVGINLGKKIQSGGQSSTANLPTSQPETITPSPSPSETPMSSPTIILSSVSPTATFSKSKSMSIYKDKNCGFQFSFPTSFLSQKSENGLSVIMTNPDNPKESLAFACAVSIPKPPLTADKIEAITLDKQAGLYYHDKTPEGLPRDEVIVKNPNNDMEVIIAGYGETFKIAIKSFKFID